MSDGGALDRLGSTPLGVRHLVVYDGVNGVGDHAVRVRFGNGYGASVVLNRRTNACPPGTFEVLPIAFNGETDAWVPCYDTPVLDDACPGLDWHETVDVLHTLADLPGVLK